jgi:hypothetical protein
MTNRRTIDISLDHLAAEIAACPLVLPESWRFALTELDGRPGQVAGHRSGNVANAARLFWRAAEQHFLSRFPHTGIDELVSLRNLIWFHQLTPGRNTQLVPLHQFLERLARSYLRVEGTSAYPQLPPSAQARGGLASNEPPEAAARRAWRWLTFSLPADLLLATLANDQQLPTRVVVVSPALEGLLREGFAETHLHYGVAFDFSMAWAAVMYAAGGSSAYRLHPTTFSSPGADNAEGTELAVKVVLAALVRYFLGAFLRDQRTLRTQAGFADWLDRQLEDVSPGVPKSDARRIRQAVRLLAGWQTGGAITAGSLPGTAFTELQAVYIRWTKASLRPLPAAVNDVQYLDPLANFFSPKRPANVSVQLQFLIAGFEYLRGAGSDREFQTLFWQVERVRCMLYRHCIQRPLTPGLTNFIRFYERKSPLSRPIENVLVESAARISGIDSGLQSLEIRTSPEKDVTRQLAQLHSIRRQFQQVSGMAKKAALETGVVLHFLKRRGRAYDQGIPQVFDINTFADPGNRSDNPSGYRWAGWFSGRLKEARAIGRAISSEPQLLLVLRGIDVCRDEPGVPTWAVAPLFAEVRKLVSLARTQHCRRGRPELPPLRTTVHVGEDFVHLASGIRVMDEALQFLELGSGDRIGHGLALGVDAVDWASRTDRVAMPREDRLFDLIWEKSWHAAPDANFPTSRREHVNREIERLGNIIFHNSATPQPPGWSSRQSLMFRSQLFNFGCLQKVGFPDRGLPAKTASTDSQQELEAYLTDAAVYLRSRAVEWVEARDEGPVVAELQRLVRKRCAESGITVEINPISNLLVGDLTDLRSHPLWRLAPRLGDEFGPTMRMCVGSDDPFVFSTSLPEEYQFLADSLVLAGKSHAEAREWLELLRRMGLESRFTV